MSTKDKFRFNIAFLLLALGGIVFYTFTYKLSEADCDIIVGELFEEPIYGIGKYKDGFRITLQEKDGEVNSFKCQGDSYQVFKVKEFKQKIEVGSEVKILTRTFFNFEPQIVAFEDNHTEYLSLENVNEYHGQSLWVLYLMWLPFFIRILYLYKFKKKG